MLQTYLCQETVVNDKHKQKVSMQMKANQVAREWKTLPNKIHRMKVYEAQFEKW